MNLFSSVRLRLAGLAVSTVTLLATPLLANDWPEWRGAGRHGVWNETGIVEGVPETLNVKWRVPISSGYSGPAVADGRVFITDWVEDPESRTMDGTERAMALGASSPRWRRDCSTTSWGAVSPELFTRRLEWISIARVIRRRAIRISS